MADQISQHVAQELPHSIDAMVQQHLGATTRSQGAVQQDSLAASIGAELRRADAVRKAVILNEILSPPLSRRDARHARRAERI
jgi:hypothetical protein